MSQDSWNEDELAEDEEPEEESTLLSEELYIPLLSKPKLLKQIPLAFIVPDDLSPVVVEGCTLAWTKPALSTLIKIWESCSNGKLNTKNLPYASLRGLLEVELRNVARIQTDLGIKKYALNSKQPPEPFAYLTDDSEAEIKRTLRSLLNDWITNFLKPFAAREKVPPELPEQLEDLRRQGELLTVSSFKAHILPWDWSKETGTAEQRGTYDYRMLADYVARQIAGQEIFQALGPMKRIISSSGSFTSGVAELITSPITLSDYPNKGTFSLVVHLEVVTFPSLHQPLLKIDVSKRRWISQLKAPSFDRDNITGFVFSQDYPDRVFSYKTICQQDKNKTWQWTTDKDFEALRRELRLPFQSFTGQEIAAGRADTETCKVLLTYRNGRQDTSKAHGIKVGVPEVNKLEAMDALAKILAPELQPFEGYEPIPSRHTLDDTASRKINIFTLLGATLETLETNYCSNFTPNYLDQLSDRQLGSLLSQNFNIGLEDINQGRKSLKFEKGKKSLDQTNELKALIQANQAAMLRLYPNEQLLLVVFYEEQLQTEVKLLQAIIRVLWGEAVELLANRLPSNTHGPRASLPATQLKAKERSQKRIEEWNKSITQQIKARNKRTFCLVMARKFYPDPSAQNKFKPDDSVNKPSTRQALAAIAGSCVQFILPIDTTQKKLLKLDNFFHRSQSALKDLLSAHSGRVEDVQEKVNKYLKDIPPKARPKEIIGITIVRKQKGRVHGFIENTFLPVAMRLNVDKLISI